MSLICEYSQLFSLLLILGWVLVLGAALTLRDTRHAVDGQNAYARRLEADIRRLEAELGG